MSSIREIRRHIRSVRNISKVTRAMQMVAASKMRRAQEQVLATRPYAQKSWELLTHLAALAVRTEQEEHPLLAVRPVQAVGLVVITSDKGLCGGYNHNLLRVVTDYLQAQEKPVKVITVGRKGRDFMLRTRVNLVADFTGVPALPTLLDVLPIARTVLDDYLAGVYDEVLLAYTDFVNTLVQRPVIRRLLPLRVAGDLTEQAVSEYVESGPRVRIPEYIYEPDPQAVLAQIVPRFTELQIYQAILESIASEHSARMVAMRNATDNANELLDQLTLSFNRARQTAITKEILDIVGGAEALAKAAQA
ncbi:MAG: ATP synthase F1 subunit gamma [Chloroflexi bacterium]|nr:ATP synthase F1 subunit gamma [Chloroflexota bacterium]